MSGWISVDDQLPDDELSVLIALDDGEVWTGFMDAGDWRFVSADPVTSRVTHWLNFPEPPGAGEEPAYAMCPTTDQVHKGDLRRVLRDLLATIELQTDCMDNTIDRATLDPYIERAEDLLGERLEEIIK